MLPSIDTYFPKLLPPFGVLGNDIEKWHVLESNSAEKMLPDCEDLSKSKQVEKKQLFYITPLAADSWISKTWQ